MGREISHVLLEIFVIIKKIKVDLGQLLFNQVYISKPLYVRKQNKIYKKIVKTSTLVPVLLLAF